MSKKHLLFIAIGLFSVICLFSIITTELLAYYFNFQLVLGKPIFSLMYAPWNWIHWSWNNYNIYPALFNKIYAIAFFVTSVLSLLFFRVVLQFRQRTSKPNHYIHGSARFALWKEVKQMGLINTDGVYIGAYQYKKNQTYYLRHNGPEHIMAFAPTRSGKGVGLVIPTLLSWPHSVVVLDIKGENHALTSGWRSKYANNKILKFNPISVSGDSIKFNPLNEIRLKTQHEVADVQNIVTMIVDPDGKGMNDHWAKTGHALLTGALLHLLYISDKEGKQATLRGLSELLSNPEKPIDEVLTEMLNYDHFNEGEVKTHPVVSSCARDMLNKATNERSSVLSTAMSFLTLYRDDIVSQNTCSSDFKIRDLMHLDQPVTLYLVIPPSDLDRLKPLIRLIINQIMRTLTEKMSFENGRSVNHYKHRLLMLLDEFPSLGRLEIFQQSLAFIAGYGIKAYLIIQDLTQLYNAYGKDESILSNCHVRITYAPNKIETAELLAKMTGVTTQLKKQKTNSGKRYSWSLNQVSESWQEVSRPLMTSDEVMRLPGAQKNTKGEVLEAGDMLIFIAGNYPIYGKQILYFKDPILASRSKLNPVDVNKPELKNKGNEVSTNQTIISNSVIAHNESDEPEHKVENKPTSLEVIIDHLNDTVKLLMKSHPINQDIVNGYFFIGARHWDKLYLTEAAWNLFTKDKEQQQQLKQILIERGQLDQNCYTATFDDHHNQSQPTLYRLQLNFEPEVHSPFLGEITPIQNK